MEALSPKHPRIEELLSLLSIHDYSLNAGVLVHGSIVDYAQNFGIQWKKFSTTQLDSSNASSFSETRLLTTTHWTASDLRGKLVLEIGSGAGRFTEILLAFGAIVVTVDLSEAIFVNEFNNSSRNLLCIRADYRQLENLRGIFDFVLALGVAQHLPRPKDLYRFSVEACVPGGQICIDHYQKRLIPHPFYHPKYFWRPITKRLPHMMLLRMLEWYIPRYIIFDTWLLRFFGKRWGNSMRGMIPIPCWNYLGLEGFPQDKESLVIWAILDTFDALAAKHDHPISSGALQRWLSRLKGIEFQIRSGGNGLISNISRNEVTP